MSSVHRRIEQLATRQDGVASRRQLVRLGLTQREIDLRLASGAFVALYRGVYAIGHQAVSDRGRCIAALLAAGTESAISHCAAAAYWPFSDEPFPATIDVTVRRRGARSRLNLHIHHTANLHPRDLRRLDGFRITSPARTLYDLAAAGLSQDRLDRHLAEARVKRLVAPHDIEEILGRMTGRAGAAKLRAAYHGPTAAPARSELERMMLRLILDAGLPRPETNARIGAAEADFLWRRERVIVETDGYHAHGHRRAFEHDRDRDAHLAARGYVVLRFTWRQIAEQPMLVATRIGQVLAVRAAA